MQQRKVIQTDLLFLQIKKLIKLIKMIKIKENKKIVKTVKTVVSEGKKDYAILKVKSKSIIADMKKRWDASEPRRKAMEADAKKSIKKLIGKKGRRVMSKSSQIAKDVVKGVRQGLKK